MSWDSHNQPRASRRISKTAQKKGYTGWPLPWLSRLASYVQECQPIVTLPRTAFNGSNWHTTLLGQPWKPRRQARLSTAWMTRKTIYTIPNQSQSYHANVTDSWLRLAGTMAAAKKPWHIPIEIARQESRSLSGFGDSRQGHFGRVYRRSFHM